MNTINDGGTAFPTTEANYVQNWSSPGMTLRNYFAGQALSGMLANASYLQASTKTASELQLHPTTALAKSAFEFADEMIKESQTPL